MKCMTQAAGFKQEEVFLGYLQTGVKVVLVVFLAGTTTLNQTHRSP